MTKDNTTSAEETHAAKKPLAEKKSPEKEEPLASAPTEWIVRKADGRMVVTDF